MKLQVLVIKKLIQLYIKGLCHLNHRKKLDILLTVFNTKGYHILCELFRVNLGELLQFYMKQVDTEKFLAGKANEKVEAATRCFLAQVAG